MACVVALAGPPASGKSTVARSLSRETNWPVVSFGQYILQIAQESDLLLHRANLQKVGQALVDKGPRRFCEEVLHWASWQPGQPLILDGIRHVAVSEELRSLTAPMSYYLVYLEIDQAVQQARLTKRGSDPPRTADLNGDPTEVEVRRGVRERADVIVDGAKPISVVTSAIVRHLVENGEWPL